MNYPTVDVIIPTYKRDWIVRKTVELLKTNLVYSGKIRFLIGMDGKGSVDKMFAGHSDIEVIPGPNKGLGANLNRLIDYSKSDYLFQLDDDHHLEVPLELNRHVKELEWNKKAGWIRLMGVTGHNYKAELKGNYWEIDWNSSELYIPSNRPHLKHKRFHKYYSLYPQKVSLGETEERFCQQCKYRKKRKIKVLIPVNDIQWNHVGESWQLRGK